MPLQEVHTFPQFSSFSLTMELGPTKLFLRMTYRERTQSWYLDVRELNDTPVVLGRRISARYMLTLTYPELSELIAGELYAMGLDGGTQQDLGKTLKLWFIPEEDFWFFQPDISDPLAPTISIA